MRALRRSVRPAGWALWAIVPVALPVVLLACLLVGLGGGRSECPEAAATTETRFLAVDVAVRLDDQNGPALAGWQAEIVGVVPDGVDGAVRLVGVEAGTAAGFTAPPVYDARALMSERVILAAIGEGDGSGQARDGLVARLHYSVSGPRGWVPGFVARDVVLGGPAGEAALGEIELAVVTGGGVEADEPAGGKEDF